MIADASRGVTLFERGLRQAQSPDMRGTSGRRPRFCPDLPQTLILRILAGKWLTPPEATW